MSEQLWSSQRHRTAIGRVGLSVPARQAVVDLQLEPRMRVLDYGCGRGGDVRALQNIGLDVSGWDPVHHPGGDLKPAEIVLLTYVLNVIEDPAERRQTLLDAWNNTRSALVVSARLRWERNQIRGTEYGDGILTSRNTFQHLFAASELRDYVQETTGVRCLSAAPGIVYAFKSDEARLGYLARQITPEAGWLASQDVASAIAAVVDHLEHRGRLPNLEEMPQPIISLLGHLRTTELRRLAEQSADPLKVEESGKRTTLDTLLFLAVELFHGRGPASSLPLPVQLDIRAFFSSYAEACKRADRLLFKLRDDAYLRRAMTGSAAGKFTATALYVHRRAVHRLPTVLRLYEQCASIAAGRPEEWSVLKLRHQGRGASWLDYPAFDTDPHPRLASSYSVDLQTLKLSFLSYADSTNRPLLHRKHEFLAPDDPDVPKYQRLTAAEVRAGLYEETHLIGNEEGWERALARCGRALRGHRLVRRSDS
ncbi:DNA phosphorothioation-associated putative methyltransferase [Streptomyces clavuligerus]|nr:DNA phosphorothioation-associated putative methyltransferase [Streptomyces clavuligerus]ANW19585.1 ribosomal methyltransferase [Streptomyces clavuligerus]AXU14191.1 DNA phosphorothioation-associated putative methyltransferase [Streptomyces clavuligerus]MBY6304188.1 DNA phosphorothioation-associated putative methyltransferase [Streptomyces clavuligerus]QCS06964.1 DNA phosphorothioation-associated putative methyltransferase [Streptomyces clavuligerus]QPJ93678.1 DNA phosphorothioation-associat